jgi:carboxypeptidase Taq
MMQAYSKLKAVFTQLSELEYINRIMMWDEATMMPEGAGETRARSAATFSCLMQKILVNSKNKKLLELAKQQDNLSDWDAANLRWMEKKYISSACIPPKLMGKLVRETLACEQAWRKLRAENNWRSFAPYFKRTFKLVQEATKRRADIVNLSLYDSLLDDYSPGFDQQRIDTIFSKLKQQLQQIIPAVISKQERETIQALEGPFAIEKQNQLGLKVMRDLNFDFNHGRLDISHHPFCNGISTDVRITTRYNEQEFTSALFGICHETGHALYEQGLPREWMDQPVGHVHSMAMHESQSLLWEMQVCRSREFCKYLLPDIQQKFGLQAGLLRIIYISWLRGYGLGLFEWMPMKSLIRCILFYVMKLRKNYFRVR